MWVFWYQKDGNVEVGVMISEMLAILRTEAISEIQKSLKSILPNQVKPDISQKHMIY